MDDKDPSRFSETKSGYINHIGVWSFAGILEIFDSYAKIVGIVSAFPGTSPTRLLPSTLGMCFVRLRKKTV